MTELTTVDRRDILAATEAEGDARIPHPVALAIMGGESPVRAFRDHRGLTQRDLSERADISVGYLSEIEHGRKPGSVRVLARIAAVLGTRLDALVMD